MVTGIDDHSRFIVSAMVVVRATARPVCRALTEALARHGVPAQILTDNGKVFTGRFGRGPGPVMFDRICADNGIKHLLTAPYSPTTTGKVERLHKTMRAEFFTPKDRIFATIPELQAALDAWVTEYNTARPHQSCGRRPPIERFRLADRSLAADDTAAAEPAPGRAASPASAKRPAGVSRWVNATGKISLAGFSYHVGASYAGEPVEAVVTGGLVDILHAGVVVATHAQRFRDGQADRAPRARVSRRARDATKGLTVTRLANADGTITFAGTELPGRPVLGPHLPRRHHRRRVGTAVQRRQGDPPPPDPPRPDPRTRRLRQPQRPRPPQELRHRLCQRSYRNSFVAQVPGLDMGGVTPSSGVSERHADPSITFPRHLVSEGEAGFVRRLAWPGVCLARLRRAVGCTGHLWAAEERKAAWVLCDDGGMVTGFPG